MILMSASSLPLCSVADPRNVGEEIADKLLACRELVCFFVTVIVPVISFPRFVVVADDPPTWIAVKQAVFELVAGPAHWHRHIPKDHLQDRAIIHLDTADL